MSVTNAQVESYINGLGLQKGSADYDIFNRLLLLDSVLFKEIIEKLISGVITMSNLKGLPAIDDSGIENFLLQVRTNIPEAVAKKNHYIVTLEEDFLFLDMKKMAIPEFSDYVYKKFLNSTNYSIPVTVDSLGLTSGSYLNFQEVSEKYISLVGFKAGSSKSDSAAVLNDLILQEKYRAFFSMHNSFQYKMKSLADLVNMSLEYPVFIKSEYNTRLFTKYPQYKSLLSKVYTYISPSVFNKVYYETIEEMVKLYDTDIPKNGWIAVNSLIVTNKWEDVSSIASTADFVDKFMRVQLVRYEYPKMYGEAFNDAVVLVDELATIENFKEYFDLASDFLNTLVNKARIGFAE